MNEKEQSANMIARGYLYLHDRCPCCGGKKFLVLWSTEDPRGKSDRKCGLSKLVEKCEGRCGWTFAETSVLTSSGRYVLTLHDRLSQGDFTLQEFWARLNAEVQALGGVWTNRAC